MDSYKIGKFIAEKRKEKKLTQASLAEKLGVTAKTISRWENGNYMPDISLLKPLSDELGISINDLLSGENVEKEDYQEKLEENIINTIDYSSEKLNNSNKLIAIILIAFGILISVTAMCIFPSESSFGSIYSVFGTIIALIGVAKITRKLKYPKRLVCSFGFFIASILLLMVIDYIGVINIHQAPRFAVYKITANDVIYYDTLFYDVVRYNPGKGNEKFEVIPNQDYTEYIDSLYE
ncbi:MAG: helix-turn-helix domain-containing protein [Clostridia bacterium]|nr:helix-turn-helix domain-containing protein [Clostridia bacterium]